MVWLKFVYYCSHSHVKNIPTLFFLFFFKQKNNNTKKEFNQLFSRAPYFLWIYYIIFQLTNCSTYNIKLNYLKQFSHRVFLNSFIFSLSRRFSSTINFWLSLVVKFAFNSYLWFFKHFFFDLFFDRKFAKKNLNS